MKPYSERLKSIFSPKAGLPLHLEPLWYPPSRDSRKRSRTYRAHLMPSIRMGGAAIPCESTLEYRWFQLIELMDTVEFYQAQPAPVDLHISGRRCRYTADALVRTYRGTTSLVEIKPYAELSRSEVLARLEAASHWAKQNACGFVILTERDLPERNILAQSRMLLHFGRPSPAPENLDACLAFLNGPSVRTVGEFYESFGGQQPPSFQQLVASIAPYVRRHIATIDFFEPVSETTQIRRGPKAHFQHAA